MITHSTAPLAPYLLDGRENSSQNARDDAIEAATTMAPLDVISSGSISRPRLASSHASHEARMRTAATDAKRAVLNLPYP